MCKTPEFAFIIDFFVPMSLLAYFSISTILLMALVIAHRLDRDLKDRIRAVLLSTHNVPSAARALQKGQIERFVMIEDESYNDIRAMFTLVGNLSTRKKSSME